MTTPEAQAVFDGLRTSMQRVLDDYMLATGSLPAEEYMLAQFRAHASRLWQVPEDQVVCEYDPQSVTLRARYPMAKTVINISIKKVP